jgi:YfiH family protein
VSRSLQARLAASGLDWIVPEWPAPQQIHAFSTTRNGDATDIQLRRWLPEQPLWLKQVHGRAVVEVDDPRPVANDAPEADAAVARTAGRVCAVVTADCMPVLMTDRSGDVVAVAHAGWRGLAAGVIESSLAAMRRQPASVLAWLGPAIGPRAFEVGADVLDAHCARDPGALTCFEPLRPGKWLADLYALARRRLERSGVTAIYGGGRCTFTESALFHSYRRDGARAGRMATMIWIA